MGRQQNHGHQIICPGPGLLRPRHLWIGRLRYSANNAACDPSRSGSCQHPRTNSHARAYTRAYARAHAVAYRNRRPYADSDTFLRAYSYGSANGHPYTYSRADAHTNGYPVSHAAP